jgi:hypothetical protein
VSTRKLVLGKNTERNTVLKNRTEKQKKRPEGYQRRYFMDCRVCGR